MQFGWIDFYSEFASKLLSFKNDRKTLISKINAVYAAIDMKVPKLESGDEIIDIDPFTVFGLFNKGITNANRIAIIGSIAKEFAVEAKVPDNFDGIPVLNNLKATFYGFKDDRKEDDIDNIWNVFEAALALAAEDNEENRQEFSKLYDLVHDQLCIRWNLTMGLYWIRPYCFINLDSRNRWYLTNVENMPAEFVEAVKTKINKLPKAADYLFVKDSCTIALNEGSYDYKNYPELSYYAWMISEQVNQEKADATGKKASKAAFLRWFRPLIQALRDLGGSASPADARKKIIENEQLSDEEVNATRGKNNVNKFENEVAFARNYLVSAGYIDKSVYGVWTLTEAGKTVNMTEELASDIFKKRVFENQNKRDSVSSALADYDVDTVHYWIYSPGENSSMWAEFYKAGIMAIGWGEIGDLKAFESKDAMKAKMKVLVDKIEEYRGVEEGMHRTLLTAQSIAQETIDKAKKEAEEIIASAKDETANKVKDTQAEINTEEQKLETARKNTAEFIAHVAKLYQSQARALAELAKGENLAPVQQTEDAKNTNATGKGDAPVEDATRKFDFGELQFGTEYDPKDVK